ncbi:MAG: AbrB/MazE/SpoVT family DNA-binding domain-containing protein [Propionibacteriaceae bacterium]|jgi:AbrB family looped-hinge helix DNA binding protein|nr:AbrB/MazE/SpoVT family DNA-binding domain-containing protein [Propionibacteriaceae bacterium]
MTRLTITAKGQVTLKKAILERLGAGPGDQVEAFVAADGSVVLSPVRPAASLADAAGMLARHVTRPVGVEELNQAIADGWAGRL